MHCRVPLIVEFIIDNTTPTWFNLTYKVYKENLLYDIERAQFPETQPFAEIYVNAKANVKLLSAEIVKLTEAYEEASNRNAYIVRGIDYFLHDRNNEDALLEAFIPGYKTKTASELSLIRSKSLRLRRNPRLRESIRNNRVYKNLVEDYGRLRGTGPALTVKRTLIKACPKSGCHAFLNEEFVCGMCNTTVCKDCHEILTGGTHTCCEDTLASIKALKAESRNCPSCATLISKIGGCDQMWCTQCKNSFSWRTGQIQKNGIIHNPHYYQWRRQTGQLEAADAEEAEQGLCNAFPFVNELTQAKPEVVEALRNVTTKVEGELLYYLLLTKYHESLQHIRSHNVRPISREDNFNLRVKLLAKEIDEQQFKILIQRQNKAYLKCVAKKHIYDMTYSAGGDILRNCILGSSMQETYIQLDALLKYSNAALKHVEKAYCCTAEKYLIQEIKEESYLAKTWFS